MEEQDLKFIESYHVPLFIPFNIRNTLIDESGKDINQIMPNKQYQTLLSYMPKEDIFRGIVKKISKKRVPFNVRNLSPR